MVTHDRTLFVMPDPLHLEDWEEQDEPMATDWHRHEQIHVFQALYTRFAGPNCYVSFDRWLRMDQGNPRDKLQADILVALGVPDRKGLEYLPWVEGHAPDLLMEFLSQNSLRADRTVKPERYAKLGTLEYFLFNPGGEYPDPRIQGWTLHTDGAREPHPVEPDGGVNSRVLPVRFIALDNHLTVLDKNTGQPLTELEAARISQRAAEAEVERLRAELERVRRRQSEPDGR